MAQFFYSSNSSKIHQKKGLLKPLALAVSACLLAACGATPKPPVTPRPAPTIKATPTQVPQKAPQVIANNNTPNNYAGVLDEAMLDELEDLLQATDMSMVEGDALTVQRYGDLWERIRRGYRMDNVQNSRIEAQKSWFYSRQSYLDRLTARASRYLHHTVTEAERRGIPIELALLPIIESSYDPSATSNAAAAGLWQFIPSTGRIYGLNQSSTYDGRRDVIESTRAAYDFLTSLYNQFGSWDLALAAYNAGPGRVSRAIKNNQAAGLPTDYWSLKLPGETMNYVPRFLAVSQIVASPSSYGVNLPAIANHSHFRTVPVNYGVSLQEISGLTGVPFDELRLLNPALTNFMVDTAGPSRVVIPDSVPTSLDASLSALAGQGNGAYIATAPAQSTQYVLPKTGATANDYSQKELMQSNTLPTTIAQITPNNTIVQEPPLTQEERDFIASQIQASNNSVQAVNPNDGNIQLEAVQTALSVLEARGESKSLSFTNANQQQVTPSINVPTPPVITPAPQATATPNAMANPIVVSPTPVVNVPTVTTPAMPTVSTPAPVIAPVTPTVAPTPKPAPVVTPAKPKAQPQAKAQSKPKQQAPESYTVKAGDNLTAIAAAHNLTLSQIASYNNLEINSHVYTGQKLWLVAGKVKPKPKTEPKKDTKPAIKTENYQAKAGESLTIIAHRHGMSVQDFAQLNNLAPTDGILIGQTLKVPASTKKAEDVKATTKANTAKKDTKPKVQTTVYTVKAGESLTAIANSLGVSNEEIAALNNFSANSGLLIGQKINVPVKANNASNAKAQTNTKATSKATTSANAVFKSTENYTVKAGESLNSLAKQYGVSASDLAKANNLKANSSLLRGQVIKVPKLTTTYTVKSGDNLISLARRFGISTEQLAKMNNLKETDGIRIGQKLTVPNQ